MKSPTEKPKPRDISVKLCRRESLIHVIINSSKNSEEWSKVD
jgi:hypothetical protein